MFGEVHHLIFLGNKAQKQPNCGDVDINQRSLDFRCQEESFMVRVGWRLHLYKMGSVCREQFLEKGIQIDSVCQLLTRQGEASASARQEGIPVHTDLLTVIRSLETKN